MSSHEPLLNSRISVAPSTDSAEASRVLNTSGGPPAGPDPVQPFTGKVIAEYHVDELVGAGGFSMVFRATRVSSGETVALKIPRAEGFLEHLRREAVVASRFVDPQVVDIREVRLDHDPPFLVMGFIQGADLALPSGPVPPAEIGKAFETFRDIAAVVARMHEAGVVHGDLKPGNLRIDPAGRCHVLDLGVARQQVAVRQVSTLRASMHSVTGEKIAGTLEYMAPEVLAGGKPGTPADVYALGVILHFLLCGRPPAFGVSPSEINPYLPPGFETFLRALLHHDPEARIGRAGALLPAIDGFIAAEKRCLARRDGHARRRFLMESLRTLGRAARILFWTAAAISLAFLASLTPAGADVAREVEFESLLGMLAWPGAVLGLVGILLGVTSINAWILRIPARTYKERPGHKFWSFMMK
ncbi:MAG: serine/threonine protein kinase [Planctomycetota bacterium]|nr:MAG: serine/threonine protein kinase [Planctomycetota bacterium]